MQENRWFEDSNSSKTVNKRAAKPRPETVHDQLDETRSCKRMSACHMRQLHNRREKMAASACKPRQVSHQLFWLCHVSPHVWIWSSSCNRSKMTCSGITNAIASLAEGLVQTCLASSRDKYLNVSNSLYTHLLAGLLDLAPQDELIKYQVDLHRAPQFTVERHHQRWIARQDRGGSAKRYGLPNVEDCKGTAACSQGQIPILVGCIPCNCNPHRGACF